MKDERNWEKYVHIWGQIYSGIKECEVETGSKGVGFSSGILCIL